MTYRIEKVIIIVLLIIALFTALYFVAVYSNTPFIAKWRTIYIETAMSTMNNQWLATKFIPKDIIDEVLKHRDEQNENIEKLVEQWKDVKVFDNSNEEQENTDSSQTIHIKNDRDIFFEKFWEINPSSFDEYINNNFNGKGIDYNNLYINKSGLNDKGTTIKTIMGERVMAIDTKNNILIVEVIGEGYNGRLAIIKNPAQVKIGISSKLGEVGEKLNDIVLANGAILGINASGFVDTDWKGNGGEVVGLLIKDGKEYNKAARGTNIAIGFDLDNNLRIGKYDDNSIFRDAVESKPALVINGEKIVKGSAGWGIQPRTVIGQSKDGEVLLLAIDGRQVGHSIGATMEQCADIMITHNALQAAALDGGSSTLMFYDGAEITRSCVGSTGKGRKLPDAFIVMPIDN